MIRIENIDISYDCVTASHFKFSNLWYSEKWSLRYKLSLGHVLIQWNIILITKIDMFKIVTVSLPDFPELFVRIGKRRELNFNAKVFVKF